MWSFKKALAFHLCALVAVMVQSSDASSAARWEVVIGLNSETLASAGWNLIGTTSVTQPDGRSTVVTFWRVTASTSLTMRCFDYFAADLSSTGGKCEQAVGK